MADQWAEFVLVIFGILAVHGPGRNREGTQWGTDQELTRR